MAFGTRLRAYRGRYARRRWAYKRAPRASKAVRTYVSRALQVRGLSRPEVKNFYQSNNIAVLTALNIGGIPCGPQNQGTTSDTFTGSSYRAMDLEIKVHLFSQATANVTTVRIMVVCDTNSGTQQLELYDTANAYNNLILQQGTSHSLVNRYRPSRFYVLYDKEFMVLPDANATAAVVASGATLNLNKVHVNLPRFNLRGAEVATVPGLTSGTWTMRRQYLLYIFADNAGTGAYYYTRMGFTDV